MQLLPLLTPLLPAGNLHLMNRWFLFLLTALATLGFSTASSKAQVLVYKLEFSNAKGVNFHSFDGGYVVVPLLGGSASFLLTSTEAQRTYTESSEGGNFFTAVSGNGDQKAVLSATTGTGTASGAMVAMGDINHVVKVTSRTLSLAAKVAKSLNGTLVSADDESEVESVAIDGSIGSAGVADVRLSLDDRETNDANKDGLSIADTLEVLKIELERQGYSAEATDDGEDTTTTSSTTTATQQ